MNRLRSRTPIIIAKTGYLAISAVMCALGVLLIVLPEFSDKVLGWVCGAMLILFGGVRLVGYFSHDLYRLAFQYDLTLGIVMIVLGVLMLAHPDSLMTVLCVAMGISVVVDGLFKVQIAFEARRFGIRVWWLILSLAILTAAAGTLVIFRPGQASHLLSVVLGITLLSEGLLSISTMITAVKVVKNQLPDEVTEPEWWELR